MIITISREYGSGGHSIGQSVAKELGIEFYDRDIIKAAMKESGLEMPDIEKVEEELTRTGMFWRMIAPAAYIDQQDNIRTIEQHIIVEMALKGPCVILGRCADDILARASIPSLNVFLYADQIHRAARISTLIDSKNPTEIQKKMQKTDSARRSYYEQFTGKHWGDSRNYSLCLDTGFLGYDACVQIICDAARKAEAFQEY
ncbi:MAG: cytidylate kinase-like family protein [Oscillospiraceae bacterium]|nr:cytidylate kinase-like family protein [Oscillospiraceae bacterium]